MVTIFNSPWHSHLYDTEIDLTDIQRRMRAVIGGCNFDGTFLKIETQIAIDPIDGSFWAFPHGHGLALVSEDFEPRKTAERINNGGRLTHFNGANCLLISNRLQSEADVARVCAYSVKETYSGIDFNPRTAKPDRSIGLMTCERCLRTTELLSSLKYNDVLIASGDLKGCDRSSCGSLACSRSFSARPMQLHDRPKTYGLSCIPPVSAATKS